MVVRATLSELTTPHLSSSVAVERVRRFHDICAAEFDPNTIGTASVDDTMNALAKWLLWARAPMVPLPPFATPYGDDSFECAQWFMSGATDWELHLCVAGPSVIFFYHNRTRGGHVTNMVDGFEWNQVLAMLATHAPCMQHILRLTLLSTIHAAQPIALATLTAKVPYLHHTLQHLCRLHTPINLPSPSHLCR